MKVNNVIKNMLNNTYVLYGVLFVALTNILGYMSHHNFESVILFALVGFLTQSFSKNMIVILLVPIVFTAVFTMLRHNMREGMDPGNGKGNGSSLGNENGTGNENGNGPSMGMNCKNMTTEKACKPSTGCKWSENKKGSSVTNIS